MIWLFALQADGGIFEWRVVNKEDLHPIIPLPCPIRFLTKVFAKIPWFYPLILR